MVASLDDQGGKVLKFRTTCRCQGLCWINGSRGFSCHWTLNIVPLRFQLHKLKMAVTWLLRFVVAVPRRISSGFALNKRTTPVEELKGAEFVLVIYSMRSGNPLQCWFVQRFRKLRAENMPNFSLLMTRLRLLSTMTSILLPLGSSNVQYVAARP